MGQPGYGPGGHQPEQPQQPAWGEPAQPQSGPPQQPGQPQQNWGETQQQPQQPPMGEQGAAPTSGPGFTPPPTSGPGYGAPTSGPGFGAPSSGPPDFGATPAMAPGFGATQPGGPQPGGGHTMAMPHLGDPQPPSGPPYAPAPSGRSPWLYVLAGTTAVFFIIAVGLGAYSISLNGDLDKANKTIATRDDTISGNTKKIKDLADELKAAEDELDNKEDENAGLEDDKETISKCLKLLFEFLDAAGKKDNKTAQRKLKELQTPCNDANRLIN